MWLEHNSIVLRAQFYCGQKTIQLFSEVNFIVIEAPQNWSKKSISLWIEDDSIVLEGDIYCVQRAMELRWEDNRSMVREKFHCG